MITGRYPVHWSAHWLGDAAGCLSVSDTTAKATATADCRSEVCAVTKVMICSAEWADITPLAALITRPLSRWLVIHWDAWTPRQHRSGPLHRESLSSGGLTARNCLIIQRETRLNPARAADTFCDPYWHPPRADAGHGRRIAGSGDDGGAPVLCTRAVSPEGVDRRKEPFQARVYLLCTRAT